MSNVNEKKFVIIQGGFKGGFTKVQSKNKMTQFFYNLFICF